LIDPMERKATGMERGKPFGIFARASLFGIGVWVLLSFGAFGQEPAGGNVPTSDDVLGCVIKPSEVITVGSSADGVIAEIPVDIGDTVEKDQIVARISSGVESAAVELAKVRANDQSGVEAAAVRLALTLDRKERAEKLFQTALETQANFIQLRKEYELAVIEQREARISAKIAKLELNRSMAVLALRTIKSPIGGLVTERKKLSGEYAEEGDDLLMIARLDPLLVEAFLPLKYWGHVKPGQEVKVVPRGLEIKTMTAKVDAVVQILDAASGTFGIRLTIPNPENATPAGLWCDLAF
jgi:RND family efflux transporter MFP subunit